jgi:SAM-dependent methyltransferase
VALENGLRLCLQCNVTFEEMRWRCPICDWQPPQVFGFPALAPDLAITGGGFKPEYFAQLEKLEKGSFWFRSRNRLIVWALQRYAHDATSFLEIGCGTGFVLSGIACAVPDLRLAGSEIFSKGLGFAAKRVPHAELLQMDARHIPYMSEFDAIGAFDVLEHIPEDETVLREVAKALRPGGRLLITVPQHQFLWSATDETAHHVRRYSTSDLRAKTERAGFHVLRVSSFVSFLLPLMLYSRRRKRQTQSATTELSVAPVVDRLFDHVMRIELLAIRMGLSLPMGGSLLLVARKS